MSHAVYGSNYPTMDHIKPKSQGGGDSLTNKTLACLHCNASKANMTVGWVPSFTLADILTSLPPQVSSEEFDFDEWYEA